MSGITPELDYQFVCHYIDGSKLLQNAGTPDEKHFGHIDQEKLERFELVGHGKSYSVNVRTGEFNLNGTKLFFEELPSEAEYKLVYFRRVRQFLNTGEAETSSYSMRYCLGLRCSYEGKNRKVLVWIEEDGYLTISFEK